jgi:hypothetical protein
MKGNLLISVVFVLSLAQTSLAQNKVKFTVIPQLSQSFGLTEYIMDIADPQEEGIYVLKSQLEFPLDVAMAGVTVGVHSTRDTLYAWSLEGGYFLNIEDPGGIMKDHDWETVWRVIGTDTVTYWGEVEKFSYTESRAEMKSALITVEGYLRVFQKRRFDIDLWGGFRYQKIEQNIIGYKGWQLKRDSSVARVVYVSSTDSAAYYRVTFNTPYVGLRSNIRLNPNTSLSAKTAFALVWASDFDDHLLRNKIATADITGKGFISGVSLRHQMPHNGKIQPFFELVGEFVYLHASGSQTQSWYGDDPASPDYDDTGVVRSGIPHEINNRQASVGLRVGLGF